MEIIVILGVAIAIGVGLLIYYAPGQRKQRRERDLRARLRKMTHGDAALMGRLIRYEKNEQPDISEAEALKRAIDRWRLERG
ncbi:MAG: hypothetical protein AAFV53_35545 [Myxococcota bacterium]